MNDLNFIQFIIGLFLSIAFLVNLGVGGWTVVSSPFKRSGKRLEYFLVGVSMLIAAALLGLLQMLLLMWWT